MEDEEFQDWKQGLSQEEYNEIVKNRRGPEEQWLKHYWRQKVKNRQNN